MNFLTMTIKPAALWAALFSLMQILTGCEKEMIVEAKDVSFSQITSVATAQGQTLHIEGLVFHSSLAVAKIDVEREGQDVTMLVRLTPTRKGLSGRFVDIPLAPGTSRILFGASKVEVWPKAP